MAVTANIYIDAGIDYSNLLTITNINSIPIDITGYTFKSQMRKSYTSSTAYEFTITEFNAVNGEILMEMSDALTETIPAGRYLYDVEMTSPIGNKTRAVEGLVIVSPQITQI